jgi:hypothetical protein
MTRPARLTLMVGLIVCVMGWPAAPEVGAATSSGVSVIVGSGSALFGLVGVPVRVDGDVLVRFHGDPGTGCAARGVCGYAGAVSWKPSSSGTLEVIESRSHGRLSYQSSLDLLDGLSGGQSSGGVTSAQVSSTAPGAQSRTICADAAPTAQGISLPIRRGRVEFTLAQSSPSVVQTRCAGPLIDYRAVVGGTVTEHIAGDSNPAFCAGLGSCGAAGALTLRPRVTRAVGSLGASAPLRTPARELLAAVGLRAGPTPSGLGASGALSWTGGGTLSADLRQGSLSCRDQTGLGAGAIVLARRGPNLAVGYTPGNGFDAVGLRTRCPGPEAPPDAIASAVVPLTALAHRQVTISLTHGARFSDDGYNGFTTPQLTLTLTRIRVRSRTSTSINPSG